jgi:hypothetical protein
VYLSSIAENLIRRHLIRKKLQSYDPLDFIDIDVKDLKKRSIVDY